VIYKFFLIFFFSSEYCDALFSALATNTFVTEVHLKRCALSTFDMGFVAKALGQNSSVKG
jgi:hypothetical protein